MIKGAPKRCLCVSVGIMGKSQCVCSTVPRAWGELSVGDELTRSRSALTFSGSCSMSRGVSGNSVRLDDVRNRDGFKNGRREGRT